MPVNVNGRGFYVKGVAFDETKYHSLISTHISVLSAKEKCTVRELAQLTEVSLPTAQKTIHFYREGQIILKPHGRPRHGLGSSFNMSDSDNWVIYESI